MEMRSEGKKRSSERAAAAAGLELLRSLSPAIAVVDIDECAGDEFELLILSVAQGRDLEMFFFFSFFLGISERTTLKSLN